MKNLGYKLIAYLLLFPANVFAQTTASSTGLKSAFLVAQQTAAGSYETGSTTGSTTGLTFEMIGSLIQLILSLLGVVFIAYIVFAGWLWMTAAGNEQKVEKAKGILYQAIIGLIIIIGAYAISYFVIKTFTSQVK
jgi:hypothetical protein